MGMTSAAARPEPGPRVWRGFIPLDRHDVRLNPRLGAAGLQVRYLISILDSMKGRDVYAAFTNEELGRILYLDFDERPTARIRAVQRLLKEAEDLGLIHREKVTGRVDKVTGRE